MTSISPDLAGALSSGIDAMSGAIAGASVSVVGETYINVDHPDYGGDVQAAIDAHTAGRFYVPTVPGGRPQTATLEIPAHCALVGDGKGAPGLRWDADLGPGVYAINADSGAGVLHDSEVCDLRLEGPATGLVMGTAGCAMDGIRLGRRADLVSVHVQRFHANIDMVADHCVIERSRSTDGHYNLRWGPAPHTFSDHVVRDTDLTGASMASIGVAPDNTIDASLFSGVHLGFAPYGIARLPGTRTRGFLVDVTLADVAFESCGLGCIYGPDQADVIHGLTRLGGGRLGMDRFGTYRIPGQQLAPGVITAGAIRRSALAVGGSYSPLEDAGASGIVHSIGNVEGCTFHNMQTAIDAATTALPIFTTTTGNSLQNRYAADWTSGLIIWTSTTTTVGDAMQRLSVDNSRTAAGADAFLGIAESPATSSGYIFIATQGVVAARIAGPVSSGAPLALDPDNAGSLRAATGAAGEREVGCALATGADGLVRCQIGVGI